MMNPDKQTYALQNPDKAYTGEAPTLRVVNLTFGKDTAEQWLYGQIVNLSEYCGVSGKITVWQLSNLTRMIVASFPYLKMSELLLFFGKFKMGAYGQFYGVIDPIVISRALRTFVAERDRTLERLHNEAQMRKELEESKQPHCTWEEWQQIKAQRQVNNPPT